MDECLDIATVCLPIERKLCGTCKVEKPLSSFNARMKNGKMSTYYHCKQCAIDYGRERYRRLNPTWNEREVMNKNGVQKCTLCKETKPLSYFYPAASRKKGDYAPGDSFCKACRKNKKEERRADPVYTERSKSRQRDNRLKQHYGIEQSDYESIFKAQGGACAICGLSPVPAEKRLDIDHCHSTGIVRGLLCVNCNLGLGQFCDDIKKIRSAIKYLEAGK
jgi:hypothetical protein